MIYKYVSNVHHCTPMYTDRCMRVCVCMCVCECVSIGLVDGTI
jgi:hypothetical protein